MEKNNASESRVDLETFEWGGVDQKIDFYVFHTSVRGALNWRKLDVSILISHNFRIII